MKKKKRAYLIAEGFYPTIHKDLKEAKDCIQQIRSNINSKTGSPKAFATEFTEKDFKERFCNCVFYSI